MNKRALQGSRLRLTTESLRRLDAQGLGRVGGGTVLVNPPDPITAPTTDAGKTVSQLERSRYC